MLAYQKKEKEYYPRSFEDAFICNNPTFIKDIIKKDTFNIYKGKKSIDEKDYYAIAKDCIESKPSFAIDILLASNDKLTNWTIPNYIEEGLNWLKE